MVSIKIPDELIEMLSKTFIQKLKLVYKNMEYIGIKEIKTSTVKKNKFTHILLEGNIDDLEKFETYLDSKDIVVEGSTFTQDEDLEVLTTKYIPSVNKIDGLNE